MIERTAGASAALAGMAAMLTLLSISAKADETGLAASHTLRKEGGKTCFADHVHSGSGDGATKEAARAAGARAWADFVDFEYGSDWARYSKAAAISVRYTKAEKGWTAWVEARPCR